MKGLSRVTFVVALIAYVPTVSLAQDSGEALLHAAAVYALAHHAVNARSALVMDEMPSEAVARRLGAQLDMDVRRREDLISCSSGKCSITDGYDKLIGINRLVVDEDRAVLVLTLYAPVTRYMQVSTQRRKLVLVRPSSSWKVIEDQLLTQS